MSPEERDLAVNLLVKSRQPYEVANVLKIVAEHPDPHEDDLMWIVGAALSRTYQEGIGEGINAEKDRMRRKLGL